MKRNKFIAFLLGAVMLFTGCESEEQKAENEKNCRQAESNAVAYIEEKYGFTPEVIESKIERSAGLLASTPLSTAMVKMTYNNKFFSVYIDGETNNTEGADNYQQDEITSALQKEIAAAAENSKGIVGEIKSVNINGGRTHNFFNDAEWNAGNLYSAYFDGENFAEVFADNACNITADYVDADLISLDKSYFDFLLKNKKTNLCLISYRTKKNYQERPDNVFADFTEIKKHAILIEESLVFVNGETEHNEYILGKHDSFYYYVSDNAPDTVSFSPTEMPDASEFDGNGIINGEFVTPAYSINSSVNERIYIYYPLSALQEKSRLATYSVTGEGENIHISPLTHDIGDYRMVYTQVKSDNSEIRFAFITEKENINNEQ